MDDQQTDQSPGVPPSPPAVDPQGQPTGALGIGGKELEPAAGGLEQPGLKDVSGKEVELPKEVVAAGVKTRATTVVLPQAVTQLGVKPVGQTVMPQGTTVALPLTDDQIALGLKQSITSSWRWLAEWCRRRLKQVHVGLKTMHGKLRRVQA